MNEEWRPIEGGTYSVSSHGRIRREAIYQKSRAGKPLATKWRHGHLVASLHVGGRQIYRGVHILVAAVFIRPAAEGELVRHIDGDRPNNHACNLEYCTRRPRDKSRLPRGEQRAGWRGDAARENTKRNRARRLYQIGACETCGEPGRDRHHLDGNTGNNAPENIAVLCRRCHMRLDGRLDALAGYRKDGEDCGRKQGSRHD